jgi:hypothetical protein
VRGEVHRTFRLGGALSGLTFGIPFGRFHTDRVAGRAVSVIAVTGAFSFWIVEDSGRALGVVVVGLGRLFPTCWRSDHD